MLFKLAPPYLCDLCPNFVCERSSHSLCSANNLCLPFVRTEIHKKSFLFSSIQECNNLPLETRKLSSPGIFKRSLLKFLHFPSGSYFFCIGDRLGWIFHTRLRLNFTALNYHLFQKNCCPQPACALCDTSIEDVKHYFLHCPSFAALCEKLFTSAAQLLGNRWHCASDKKKIDWLLSGISTADFQINWGCPVVYFAMKSLLLVAGCVIYLYMYIIYIFCLFVCFFLLFFRFFLCVCSIVKCICIFKIFKCKQRKLSRWALWALRANVVINIVHKKKTLLYQEFLVALYYLV